MMSFTELLIRPLHSANEGMTSDHSKIMGRYHLQPKKTDKKTVEDQ